MKLLKNTFSFLFLIVLLGVNSSVMAGHKDQSGVRNLKNFNAIKVSAGIDLYLSMGNEERVRVEADEDIIDDVITEMRQGTLNITMENKNWLNIFNWGKSNRPVKVYVTVKELKSIEASSGTDVKTEDRLRGDKLRIKASSGSDVNLDVVYNTISLNASSGSDAKIRGRAKIFRVSCSSGSDINARNLESAICHVAVSSGSDATVTVTDELFAEASSGGDVRYYGNPPVREIDTSSGGDISGR